MLKLSRKQETYLIEVGIVTILNNLIGDSPKPTKKEEKPKKRKFSAKTRKLMSQRMKERWANRKIKG